MRRVERPDAILSDIQGLSFGRSRVFGEVKSEDTDERSNAMDLLRIATFAKDCIDSARMNRIVVFQAVGGASCKMINYSVGL